MKQCQKCGNYNSDNDFICSSCGSSLDGVISGEPSNNAGFVNNQNIQGKNETLAIASMALGIASIVFICCCAYLSIILGITGVVLGFVAKNKIRQSGGSLKGDGFALAGIITGFIGFGFAVSYIIWSLATGAPSRFIKEFQRQFNENAGKSGF